MIVNRIICDRLDCDKSTDDFTGPDEVPRRWSMVKVKLHVGDLALIPGGSDRDTFHLCPEHTREAFQNAEEE